MARILALDYGTKRTGIAVTDELQLIASGLTTVNTNELLPFLKKYLETEDVALILLGEPKRLNNVASDVEVNIQKFRESLEKMTSIPIKRVDERFTSKIAAQSMLDSGMKKKQRKNKALLDEISATIILQSYLYNQ
ncbi:MULTISPECIES: Holliday junction resolvase RuvX [unclassified Leeuwenhoekiella]|uniref:Holliday junction resolvase RuvX n=1 Tax=unclassified Leeuwenhoekiella TaxID=2615029 RepID=UPI000C3FAECD|nr:MULTISPECIES: Holliday junction resolvase RuvX [unclassified Leeuwenhoekiella]MAW94893.1 Holliday junction resolvase RuvX [Leeuwenhoekiella sp.]MBA79613.1 Holliday junction resolvase RuvX [Leeuwenhoekiella sp.]|tara:strand:+ start:9438 stop:9845 length:408 start_codon:yes stop_codon:yes gene_type:complete